MLVYKAARDFATSETRLLDVGSKTGEHLAGVDGEVVALDIEFQEVSSPVSYVLADGCRLPFPDDSFDMAVSNQVLEHVSPANRELMIREISRVLKPQGKLLVSTPNRYFPLGGVSHTLPPFYAMLPRKIGLFLGSFFLTDEQLNYYRNSFFPVSSGDIRQILQKYFDETEYISVALGAEYGEEVWPSWFVRLFDTVQPVRNHRLFVRTFETMFSYTAYRCQNPIC
jgi:ubiquinone/menaquinone biosynthesis C-methylase UbiE